MSDLDVVLEAGSLLIIETGYYSASSWHGPVRMLKSVSKRELAKAYRNSPWESAGSWDRGPKSWNFLPWLIKEGYAETVDNVTSWHVGDGEFEP